MHMYFLITTTFCSVEHSDMLFFIYVGLKCFSYLRALFLMDEENIAIDVLAKIINTNLTTFHELIWLIDVCNEENGGKTHLKDVRLSKLLFDSAINDYR